MNMQTPGRVLVRQTVRNAERVAATMRCDAALADRAPDYWRDEFGPYQNRRTRRRRQPRHAATGTVTERSNRSDTARHARARRIKLARRGLAA